MISIGLAGWGDHDDLYEKGAVKPENKLKIYNRHFPVVEVDSSFYAVLQEKTYSRWVAETTHHFSFIIKVYQGMTGHLRGKNPFSDDDSMYRAFCESIRPVTDSGKLKAVLFQYPPWFDCTRGNVDILRGVRERMRGYPVALEFRNQSWFTEDTKEKTLAFMEREEWIHSICDEPQAGLGSVPTVLVPTSTKQTIVRMHGRNASGWNQNGNPNWRATRYLYRYNREELTEWKDNLLRLSEQTGEISVIFNNNSGGDAAANAKELMTLLGMKPEALAPRQLELFE
ncbi:MAG: hypothetical protein K0S39_2645 [Paenibacillus sp.]|nr:hypothetical protein [Paenibacillus sp.]